MSHAGWLDVWNLVLALVAREPPLLAILIWLAFAFALLMIAEGLRANFFPFRPVGPRIATPSSGMPVTPPQVVADSGEGEPMTEFSVAPAKFAPRPLARNAKRRIISLRRQTPPKPQIKRLPRTVEPPKSGPIDVTSVFEQETPETAAPAELHHLTALPPDAFAAAAVQAANVA
jgi:hypothetical protein